MAKQINGYNKVTNSVRFATRQGLQFSDVRCKTVRHILSGDALGIQALASPLIRRYFSLKRPFKLLDLKKADFELLSGIDAINEHALNNLVDIAVLYILNNTSRIKVLDDLSSFSSSSLLRGRTDQLVTSTRHLDRVDRESILVLRIEGGLSIGNHKNIVRMLSGSDKSKWVREQLLYPFVYHVINVPIDSYIDTLLGYTIPQNQHYEIEKDLIKVVLRDDITLDFSFALKLYVGLACHPYDLLEIIANHFELEIASAGQLSLISSRIFNEIKDQVSSRRLDALKIFTNNAAINYVNGEPEDHLRYIPDQAVPQSIRAIMAGFSSLQSSQVDCQDVNTDVWVPLANMRYNRYPTPEDFESVTEFGRAWRFLQVGRLINSILTSLYMVDRTHSAIEIRDLIRLYCFLGCVSPYLFGSPNGDKFMRLITAHDIDLRKAISAKVSAALHAKADTANRTWFHAVHWQLNELRDSGKIRQWLAKSRESFPIKPRYLTGIDWAWIEEALSIYRITPFRETSDGPYVLLLQETEEKQRETTVIRTSIEHQTVGRSCHEFVRWLIEEYDVWSIAFVRYFLVPENILLLGLAPNMMAALSERIAALETCVAVHGFHELLSEEKLRQERQTLTSALMLLNVNANQFDIPWETFKRDIADRQIDGFNAYKAVWSSSETVIAYLDAISIYPHKFANGRVVHYDIKNADAPIGFIIFRVIDGFIEHPSYGIEAILSTRFRHDTVRREFASTLNEVGVAVIAGTLPLEVREITNRFQDGYISLLDQWLGNRMQTVRPGFDQAMFDFCPSPKEMNDIIHEIGRPESFSEIIEIIIRWLDGKLQGSLSLVRNSFIEEHIGSAATFIAEEAELIKRDALYDRHTVDRVKSAVTDALIRRGDELLEWFKSPDVGAQKSLTYSEMKMAVEGRFERAINDGSLTIKVHDCEQMHYALAPEKLGSILTCSVKS